jgi:hypothetical protein
MIRSKTWTVELFLSEEDGHTRAEAVLRSGADRELRAVGRARRHPDDAEIPEIGDEVATSRALSELAHKVLDAAASDIEAATGRAARVHA